MGKKELRLSVSELDKLGITLAFPQYPDTTAEENTRRLAACWGACEGIETAELNEYRAVSAKEYQEIERQRDQLLAALESFGHKSGCRKNAFGDTCTCGVDAVIASVKGGAT